MSSISNIRSSHLTNNVVSFVYNGEKYKVCEYFMVKGRRIKNIKNSSGHICGEINYEKNIIRFYEDTRMVKDTDKKDEDYIYHEDRDDGERRRKKPKKEEDDDYIYESEEENEEDENDDDYDTE